jgi:hypothetical protein
MENPARASALFAGQPGRLAETPDKKGQKTRQVLPLSGFREIIGRTVIEGKFKFMNFPSITRRGLIVIDPKPGAASQPFFGNQSPWAFFKAH